MKKLYSTIMMLAILVAALSFTACGGDNDGDNGGNGSGTLVGKWKCTYVDYGNWASYNVDSGTSVGDLIYFNADNTYYTVAANVNDSGTWSLSGNHLTIISNKPNRIKMVYDISLTGNKFTITIDSMIFKYVRVGDDEGGGAGAGNNGGNPGGGSSSSTFKMVSSYGGEYYIENGNIDYSIGNNRGNLSEYGHIWCHLRATKHDGTKGMSGGYFRIKLENKKSISDFPKGYDLGELDMNFATQGDYNNYNKFDYISGSIKVIANDGKSFTLEFDNYVAGRSSGWTMTVNGTLYVENEIYY